MKVLLLNPISPGQRHGVNIDPVMVRHTGARTKAGFFPPTGLLYSAALLRQNGFDVTVIDPVPARISFNEVLARLPGYDMIIVPLATSNASGVFRLFEAIPAKKRVLIGPYATAVADALLSQRRCDIVIRQEPELSVLELCRNQGDPRGVNGVSYREGETIVTNPPRPLIDDLDTLPFPARDLIDNTRYQDPFFAAPTALVLTSRGCPYSCTFCATKGTYGTRVRYRAPERVVQELEEVVQRYGLRYVFFGDDTFTLDEERVVALCAQICRRRLGIRWTCNGRVDLVSARMLTAMRDAGCEEIRYGIESASMEVLRHIGKGTDLFQIDTAARMTKQAGIAASAFFMFGCPGETRETIRETIAFARRLRPFYAVFTLAVPAPGSHLFDGLSADVKNRLTDRFDTLCADSPLCPLSSEELTDSIRTAYRSFYGSISFAGEFLRWSWRRPVRGLRVLALLARAGGDLVGTKRGS